MGGQAGGNISYSGLSVTRSSVPPAAGTTQTSDCRPRSELNEIHLPSGDQVSPKSLRTSRVSWRAGPPSIGMTQMSVVAQRRGRFDLLHEALGAEHGGELRLQNFLSQPCGRA